MSVSVLALPFPQLQTVTPHIVRHLGPPLNIYSINPLRHSAGPHFFFFFFKLQKIYLLIYLKGRVSGRDRERQKSSI